MRKFVYFFLLILLSFVSFAQKRIYLADWQFYQAENSKKHKATVPGTVHTDLLANKLIPDPFYGANENAVQWIDTCNWIYETSFEITSGQMLQSGEINLIFEGLDTYADIFVNEEKVGSNTNMFYHKKIPLFYQSSASNHRNKLREGKNTVKVVFHSVLKEIRKYKPHDYLILDEEPRAFARKAQYQFGWDWGPKFATMEIWKPVYLECFDNESQFRSVSLKQKQLNNISAILELQAKLYIFQEKERCKLIVKEKNSEKILLEKNILSQQRDSLFAFDFSLENPERWYPNGLGQPHLYDFQIELYNGKGIKVDSIEKQIGFRNVELKREKDEKGERFYFLVNGKEVFMKGANWIPAESFLPRLTEADYDALILQAKLSHFNMLRVWGGGIYEDEAFYNACDKYGILVWQDFAFACALYPANKAFLEDVKREAVENIQRISQHASLALWCGNNENDEGWHNWGWKAQFGKDTNQTWENYKMLFQKLLPDLVKQYDPQHSYLSSSPVLGWGKKESMSHGDSHYWGVWWGMEPFEVYKQKVPRFMSEYGFQGFPPISSLKKVIPEDELYLGSPSMKTHQKHPKGYETIQTYMEREYNIPLDFEKYAYVSQLLQAYGMKTAMDAHRRAKPYCMGSLYWQFNDCWPVVSWSGIDYYKEWKALQYFAKKAFAQHLVSFNTVNDNTGIWLVTDSTEKISGQLQIIFCDFSGKELSEKSIDVTLNANESKKVWGFKTGDFVKDTTQTYCYARFTNNGKLLADEVHYFALPKNVKYPKATVTVSFGKENELILKSDKLVKNVCILHNGSQSGMSDNFFDILPNQTYTIYFPKGVKLNRNNLKIQALNDELDEKYQ